MDHKTTVEVRIDHQILPEREARVSAAEGLANGSGGRPVWATAWPLSRLRLLDGDGDEHGVGGEEDERGSPIDRLCSGAHGDDQPHERQHGKQRWAQERLSSMAIGAMTAPAPMPMVMF